METKAESQALTLAVAIGLISVFLFWLVVVAVLLIDFAPGTNETAVATDTTSLADEGGEDAGESDESADDADATPGERAQTTAEVAEAEPVDAAGDEQVVQVGAGENELASIAHRVAPGDTLTAIGTEYGVDWREVASINNIADPNLIAAGRILQIPDPDAVALVTISSIDPATVDQFDAIFDSWAAQTDVPVELLKAVAWQESRWEVTAVGLQGEVGIGQLLPEIHSFVETDLAGRPLEATDAADSIEAMSLYLGWLLAETQGDTSATLASYHQGLVSQRNIGWDEETIRYIASVVGFRPEFVDRSAA